MKIRRFKSKTISLCLIIAIVATFSMVALAGEKRIAGEILVSGTGGNTPVVTVNGEAVKNGRSIFSSSSIVTAEYSSAIVKLGKLGTLRIAPNTKLVLSFDNNGISGSLLAGKISVLNTLDKVRVSMPDGTFSELIAGNSASTTPQDDDDDDGGSAWWIWAIVFGGAAAAILVAVGSGNNRVDLGGGTSIVSANT